MILVAKGGGSKKGAAPATTQPSNVATQAPSPTPPPLLAPIAVTSSMDGLAVILSWSEPTGGATVDRFTIYRNTNYLASVVSYQHPDHDTEAWPPKS